MISETPTRLPVVVLPGFLGDAVAVPDPSAESRREIPA